jgi:ferritin-like metal-binding protein YciE
VAETSVEVIKRYLEDAIASEKSFEARLREFAQAGDDAEVQTAFLAHAEESRLHHERLTQRLRALGGSPSAVKSFFDQLFSFSPKSVQLGQSPVDSQEAGHLVENLVLAFSVSNGQRALYEAFAAAAIAAGDEDTEQLARDIQRQETEAAEKLWHFLPSRAKIAFNLRTAGEIDPAVETKAPDDRLYS